MTTNRQIKDKITNSSSIYNTVPGVCLCSPSDLEDIRIAYNQNIGELTAPVAHYIETCIRGGMEPAVIREAIERTGWAPRPTPFYLRAILQRFQRDEVRTMKDVEREQVNRQQRRENAGWFVNPAQNYQQRTYKEQDFGDDFFVDLSKY